MGAYLSHRKREKFFVVLCGDVLLDVLQFGNRRQLVKLERFGRRIHFLVENSFEESPFLRLNFQLKISARPEKSILRYIVDFGSTVSGTKIGSEGVLKAFIGVDKKPIALSELVDVPRFFRFGNITLYNSTGFQSIAQKCESFRGYLSSIKSTLYDSNIIHFRCEIDKEDPTQFTDYSALLEHIRQIVSICDSSRGYSFVVWDYDVGSEAFANLIVSILEMPEIARSSLVTMIPTFGIPTTLIELPVEAISNWLNQERHSMNQNQRQRHFNLSLFCPVHYAQIQKMCDFLKQKFTTDKLPAVPFNLKLYFELYHELYHAEVEAETVINKKINEQFSVATKQRILDKSLFKMIEVKRNRAPTKKGKNS